MAEKNLTPEQLKDFSARLKKAIETADAAIYGTARDLPSAWDKVASAFENVLTLGVLTETKANVARSYQFSVNNWESRKKILWSMVGATTFDGQPINERVERAAFAMVQGSIDEVRKAIATVSDYGKGTVLSTAIGDAFGKILSILSGAFDTVVTLGKAAVTTASWLPWIIGGAIILPFALRTFSAYKRGGAAAAADEAAGSIERGRSAAGSAIATGARKLATRGMAGMRRRRR